VVALDFSCTDSWAKLRRELGVGDDREKEFEAFWDEHEPEACAGRDVETLMPLIREKFGSELPSSYSLLIDGFVKRFKTNRSIWPVIEKAHERSRIGLLTNMYPNMLDAIREYGFLPEAKWDIIVDSSVVGLQKPEPKIFDLAEKMAGAKGKGILFIDNSVKNIDAAKEFGWSTFLYDSANPKESSKKLASMF
jgi:FMN phosphatase YigB (HAD superfamily)